MQPRPLGKWRRLDGLIDIGDIDTVKRKLQEINSNFRVKFPCFPIRIIGARRGLLAAGHGNDIGGVDLDIRALVLQVHATDFAS